MNITNELFLDQIDHDELEALLAAFFNFHRSHSDKNSEGGLIKPHTIVYGNDELLVTYKSGTRLIRLVESTANLETSKLLEIKSQIENLLVKKEGVKTIGTVPLFMQREFNENFKHEELFQLIQTPPELEKVGMIAGDHPLLLQYSYIKTEYNWLNLLRRNKTSNSITYVLASLFPFNFDKTIKNPIGNGGLKSWVINLESDSSEFSNEWRQHGYFLYKANITTNEFISADSYVQNDLLNHLVRSFYSLRKEEKDKFVRGCFWFHKAIIDRSQTNSFLNCAITIESFLPNESETCDSCGGEIFKISEKFREFIMRYSSLQDETLIRKFYSLRSKIAHQAVSISNEEQAINVAIIPNNFTEDSYHSWMITLCSEILTNWMLEKSIVSHPQ